MKLPLRDLNTGPWLPSISTYTRRVTISPMMCDGLIADFIGDILVRKICILLRTH